MEHFAETGTIGPVYITFPTMTLAQKGHSLLESAGVSAVLVRVPRDLARMGCGFGLRLDRRGGKAAALLRDGGVLFSRAFLRKPDGSFEELSL